MLTDCCSIYIPVITLYSTRAGGKSPGGHILIRNGSCNPSCCSYETRLQQCSSVFEIKNRRNVGWVAATVNKRLLTFCWTSKWFLVKMPRLWFRGLKNPVSGTINVFNFKIKAQRFVQFDLNHSQSSVTHSTANFTSFIGIFRLIFGGFWRRNQRKYCIFYIIW